MQHQQTKVQGAAGRLVAILPECRQLFLGANPGQLAVICLVLIVVSRENFLLFHAVAEGVSIVVGIMMCVMAWYSWRLDGDKSLTTVANGFFWAAIIDFVHVLAYKGMGVMVTHGANEATQLWLAARSVQALSLLVASLTLSHPVNRAASFAAFGAVAAALVVLVFTGLFPAAFVEGAGLTPFKIVSEYAIIVILAVALLLLLRRDGHAGLTAPLALSIAFSIGGELAFTFYVNVYGLSNLIGHIFKLAAFWVLFHSIIKSGLLAPYRELLTEVAHRIQVESDLRRTNLDLEHFAHVASHDLREPLRLISSYMSLLERRYGDRLDQDAHDYMQYAREGAERLNRIVLGLVDFSRANQDDDEHAAFGIRDAAAATLAALSEPLARTGAKVALPESNPTVLGDRDMVCVVLQNLISNAVQFARPSHAPEIVIGWEEEDFRLAVSVTDNGIGIPQEDRERVFEVFQRGELGPLTTGSGIGLAVCRRVIKRHGGQLSMRPNPAGGSVFSFDLPLAEA